jgi:hypothetical protein
VEDFVKIMRKNQRDEDLACLAGVGLAWLSLSFMIHGLYSSIGRDQ